MIVRHLAVLILVLLVIPAAWGADSSYVVKLVENTPPPTETAEAVAGLLEDRCVQLLDAKGELLVELWFRRGVPAKATEAQIDNGLTYQELPETTLVGVVLLSRTWSDYRKQKLMPGVYTLRVAFQPVTDDHVGTAPYPEFCLLSSAADDKDPATMEPKSLREMSAKVAGKHPAVLLLVPGKGAASQPKLLNRGSGHWVLLWLLGVQVGPKACTLPLGLTLLGASSAL
jgi:hypothetical protein